MTDYAKRDAIARLREALTRPLRPYKDPEMAYLVREAYELLDGDPLPFDDDREPEPRIPREYPAGGRDPE